MKVFVSYSGLTNTSAYFDRFCALLNDELANVLGDKHVRHVIWDEALGQGDQWPDKLAQQLNEADVLLLLYSPLYFASNVCGRELGFFLQRIDRSAAGASLPVLPVWWYALNDKDVDGFSKPPRSGDAAVDLLQHRTKDATEHGKYSFNTIERSGLSEFLTNEAHVDYQPALRAYIRQLAERICQLKPQPGVLRKNPSSLLPSPDVWAVARGGAAARQAPALGASLLPLGEPLSARVHFVIVAARPEEIAGHLNSSDAPVEAYQLTGGRDWRPFWPATGYIGFWLQRIVQRNFDGCEANVIVETDPSKAMTLAMDIARQSQPLFFIVDAWTSRIGTHCQLVAELSKRNLPHCAVVVPFASANLHPNVLDELHELLADREGIEDVLCQTYVAVNDSELEDHIARLHEKMREKFRTRAALATKRRNLSPFGGGAKPTLGAVEVEASR